MFGEPEYLSMFSELYVATMRHMQVRVLWGMLNAGG